MKGCGYYLEQSLVDLDTELVPCSEAHRRSDREAIVKARRKDGLEDNSAKRTAPHVNLWAFERLRLLSFFIKNSGSPTGCLFFCEAREAAAGGRFRCNNTFRQAL
jgi:hypothetical protein